MNHENMMQSKRSQTQKDKCCMIPFTWKLSSQRPESGLMVLLENAPDGHHGLEERKKRDGSL